MIEADWDQPTKKKKARGRRKRCHPPKKVEPLESMGGARCGPVGPRNGAKDDAKDDEMG